MKTQPQSQRQSTLLALRLDAAEATWLCWLGFQVEECSQDQRGAKQILQIDDAADRAGSLALDLTCMKCYSKVSVAEHQTASP